MSPNLHAVPTVRIDRPTRASVQNGLELLAMEHNHGDLAILQDVVVEWADYALPNRTPEKAIMKLFEEVGEVIRNPTDQDEWADVFILMLDLAKMYGVKPYAATLNKLVINFNREWAINELGVYNHDRSND